MKDSDMRKLLCALLALGFSWPAYAASIQDNATYGNGQSPTTVGSYVSSGAAQPVDSTHPLPVAASTASPSAVQGNVASGATDSGNPVKTGAIYNSSPVTVTNGQRVDSQADAHGSHKMCVADTNGACTDPTTAVATYQAPQSISGAGIAPVASTSAESNHVIKSGAGNLYGFEVTSGATPGLVMVFNATSLPSNGAVTPIKCIVLPANATVGVDFRPGPTPYFSTGITIGFSTGTNCFSLTASATAQISAEAQ